MRSWQAERNFGRLVDAAQDAPQMLLRHAEPVGIMLSVEHYGQLKAQADAEFANFLVSTPLDVDDFRVSGVPLVNPFDASTWWHDNREPKAASRSE